MINKNYSTKELIIDLKIMLHLCTFKTPNLKIT